MTVTYNTSRERCPVCGEVGWVGHRDRCHGCPGHPRSFRALLSVLMVRASRAVGP